VPRLGLQKPQLRHVHDDYNPSSMSKTPSLRRSIDVIARKQAERPT